MNSSSVKEVGLGEHGDGGGMEPAEVDKRVH